MDSLAAFTPAHAPPPRRVHTCYSPPAAAAARQVMKRREEEQAERLAEAGLIQFTALPEPRTATRTAAAAATARSPWRCRVCQVDCGGRDGFREHCMSDEHYAGLQLFVLHSNLFH
uniref:U1-type domain-containing protein n=1 Tax=Leersia perrieri TaxID=77586 RepID=A0A0D9Y0L1_9ORYZ